MLEGFRDMFYPVVHAPLFPHWFLLQKLLSSPFKAPPRPRLASPSSLHDEAQHQSIDVDLTRCARFLVGWSTDEGMYASD